MGNSLKQLMEEHKIRVIEHPTNGCSIPFGKRDAWQQDASAYRLQLKYGRKSFSFDFFQGPAIKDQPMDRPSEVLDCLLSEASGGNQSFEDFCSDFGYDIDSRKAEQIWRACKKTAEGLDALFGDDLLQALMYAERD